MNSACLTCGGLPPGESSGAGDLCYCKPDRVDQPSAEAPQDQDLGLLGSDASANTPSPSPRRCSVCGELVPEDVEVVCSDCYDAPRKPLSDPVMLQLPRADCQTLLGYLMSKQKPRWLTELRIRFFDAPEASSQRSDEATESTRSKANFIDVFRALFAEGVKVARSYGDNAVHLYGDQLERQFQAALARTGWYAQAQPSSPSPREATNEKAQGLPGGDGPAGSGGSSPVDGVGLIAAERRRQVEAEGWTPEHDDSHNDGSLAGAAACLAVEGTDGEFLWVNYEYSWISGLREKHAKSDRVRQLVIAGALIAAEIDRKQRCVEATDFPIGTSRTTNANSEALSSSEPERLVARLRDHVTFMRLNWRNEPEIADDMEKAADALSARLPSPQEKNSK